MAKSTKGKASAKPAKAKKASSDEFIPEDALNSGSSRYLNKLPAGITQVRIISNPIAGWLEWVDKKPIRTPLSEGEPEASDEDNRPKKFLAMAVIDKSDDSVKIMEITQQSIIKAIRALTNNPDWGEPFSYDLNIEKTGEDLKTKYTVTPSPKKPLSKDQVAEARKNPCNLEALFEGEDPWDEDNTEHTEYHLVAGKR